jgi:hypothetical protein
MAHIQSEYLGWVIISCKNRKIKIKGYNFSKYCTLKLKKIAVLGFWQKLIRKNRNCGIDLL